MRAWWWLAALLVACGNSPPIDDGFAIDAAALVTTEAGGAATFTVALFEPPAAAVAIPIAASVLSEAAVSPTLLVFDPGDWNVAQTVTVTGLDDDVADGPRALAIVLGPAASDDARWDALDPIDLEATNLDDDAAGITVTAAPLVVQETGERSRVMFALASQPTSTVTIALTTDRPDEVRLEPATLVVEPGDWRTPRELVVRGLDDARQDGAQPFAIVIALQSGDPSYAALAIPALAGTNLDDDTAGFVVTPMTGLAVAEGGAATFAIRLTTEPTADVTIALATSDPAAGTVATSSVTFTPASWQVSQLVEVRATADDIDDGDAAFAILTVAAVSDDPLYAGLDPSDVAATRVDDDTARVIVTPTSLTLREDGGTTTFAIRLATRPLANVTIALVSTRPDEAMLAVDHVTFTPLDWDSPQTIGVTPVQDELEDGPQLCAITTAPATSGDPRYQALDAPDVTVTNLDDDCAHQHRC